MTTLCFALASCTLGTQNTTLPSDGPTMAEIYRHHMSDVNRPLSSSLPIREFTDLEGDTYRQVVAQDMAQRFVRLPNPDLIMYVTPHLSANGKYPVPGYSTVFPMFETVHYALPGEVPWRRMTTPAIASAPASATAAR